MAKETLKIRLVKRIKNGKTVWVIVLGAFILCLIKLDSIVEAVAALLK